MNEEKKTEFCLQTVRWVREMFLDPKTQAAYEEWQKKRNQNDPGNDIPAIA